MQELDARSIKTFFKGVAKVIGFRELGPENRELGLENRELGLENRGLGPENRELDARSIKTFFKGVAKVIGFRELGSENRELEARAKREPEIQHLDARLHPLAIPMAHAVGGIAHMAAARSFNDLSSRELQALNELFSREPGWTWAKKLAGTA